MRSAISTDNRENLLTVRNERVLELTYLHAVKCIEAGVHRQGFERDQLSFFQALVYSSENGIHLRRQESIVLSREFWLSAFTVQG